MQRNKLFLKIVLLTFCIIPLGNAQNSRKIDTKTRKLADRIIGVDTHNHVDVPLEAKQLPGPATDLSGELKKSGLGLIIMTFAVDYQQLSTEGQAYERFLNGLTAMDSLLKNNHATRVYTIQDINKAHTTGSPMVIQSVEGGHFLEGKIDRLQVAYNRGLRQLGLLHDSDASTPLGDIYTNAPQWGGLTSFGAQVIKECERLGILIDLTHCDNTTIDMALKIATKPMLISHTGLDTQLGTNENMARMMKPRLISKAEAKKVADAGGVIGVWTHLSDTPLEYAQNIKAMVDIVGIDHVCIGTDTKLTTPYRSPFDVQKRGMNPPDRQGPPNDQQQKPTERNKKDTLRDSQQVRVGERTNLVWKDQTDGFLYTVVDALQQVGFSENDIQKICSGNYLRIFKEATQIR